MRVNGFLIAGLCLSLAIIQLCTTLNSSPISRFLLIPSLEALTIFGIFILLQIGRRNIILALTTYLMTLAVTAIVFLYLVLVRNVDLTLEGILPKIVNEAWKPAFLAIPASTVTWLFLRSVSRSRAAQREYYLFPSDRDDPTV